MRSLVLLAAIWSISAASLLAQQVPPVEGTLVLSGKSYRLLHAVAYETKFYDDPVITIIASDRPLNVELIKKSLIENGGEDNDLSLRQPHVKVTFNRTGQVRFFQASAPGFATNTGKLSGELKLDGGGVTGHASIPDTGEDVLHHRFDVKFALALANTSANALAQSAPLAKLGVSGTFEGNGRPAKIGFVSARVGEPFDNQLSIVLVFTEKNHRQDPRSDFKAGFGSYGGALIISCHEDGSVFGCQVVHAAHSKQGFSSVGSIDLGEFQIAGGQVQGKLTTGGEIETFGETWKFNLQFAAPLAGANPGASTATTTTTKQSKHTAVPKPTEDQPAIARLKAKDLAILEAAANLELKAIVEQITFTSDKNYKVLAAELMKKLDAQGWTKDGPELVGVSAILKRQRGEASLTIFVKPAGTGSTVSMGVIRGASAITP